MNKPTKEHAILAMEAFKHLKEVVGKLTDRQLVCVIHHDNSASYAIWDTNYSAYGLGGQFVVPFSTIDALAIKEVTPCMDDHTGEPWFALPHPNTNGESK